MDETPPLPLEYQALAQAGTSACPICLKPIDRPHKCKTLYGVIVCNRCRNGFANRRQMAYIFDAVLYTLLLQAITYLTFGFSGKIDNVLAQVLFAMVGYLVLPFLFTFKDAFAGWSPGKWICGIRVVDAVTREPIPPIKSMQRNLVLMIPYVGVIGGLVTMMKGQRWGDGWANTMVTWCKYSFREPFARAGRYCRGCGYDLTGNVSGRCSECGMDIAANPTTPAT